MRCMMRYRTAFCLLFTLCISSGIRTTQTWERDEEEDFIRDDNPTVRSNWFNFVRSYPFGSAPDDARREAWESIRQNGYDLLGPPKQAWTSIGPEPSLPYFANRGITSGRINAVAVSPADPE